MTDVRKNSLKSGSACILALLMLITSTGFGNYAYSKCFGKNLTTESPQGLTFFLSDTIPLNPVSVQQDTIPFTDSLSISSDSLITVSDTFNLNVSKDSLTSPISYYAKDSMVLMIPEKKIVFYKDVNVKMEDTELTADSIIFEQETKLLTATYRYDTLGRKYGVPRMVQGETTMDADKITFNIESQKGITTQTFTQQGEIFIQGERIKKISVSEFFAARGQFTTCNLDVPHFAFRANKLKLINKKMAISGPIHPEFEGVPIPIYLPFGYFPISSGRHSGFLPPRFTTVDAYGLGLQGLGYYKVLNDYLDVTVDGDIYSYGGWRANVAPAYRVRYRYNGSMNLSIQSMKSLSTNAEKEFTTGKTFQISWIHNMDPKARPGTTFSANVSAGSTKYNSYEVYNQQKLFTNSMNSHITFSKSWNAMNLSLSGTHSQNNRTGEVSISLPNLSFTANTFYPFQSKTFAGQPKWYQKLGIGLQSTFNNRVTFYDSAFSFSRLLDTLQWGAMHKIPIQLSLPQLGPIQIAPGISFEERWYSRKLIRNWNDAAGKVDTLIEKGFYAQRQMSFSVSLNTAVFGIFDKFGPKSSVRAIRHVIRPTISASYRPDMTKGAYQYIQTDTLGRQRLVSYFDGTIGGPFSPGEFGGLSFGVDNNLEMKVRNKKDTTENSERKIKIIDGFGFNGSYNFLKDTQKLSDISFYVRSTLFDKINITASGRLNPYLLNEFGDNTNLYAWQGDKFSLGKITNASIAVSTSFQSKPKDEKKAAERAAIDEEMGLPPMTLEEQLAELQYIQQNPAEFADFNIPWSLNISFSLSYTQIMKRDYTGWETIINSSAQLNGDFNLTPKWKIGMNTYVDIRQSNIQALSMYLSREMHCWQLSINVTPVGPIRSFNFTINPKSGLLRDLKINRSRSFRNF